jgi:signal transduction histidine kinase
LFEPFVAWATRLRNRWESDPFLKARIRTALLYFLSGAVVLVVMDFFVDSEIRQAMYAITVDETGTPLHTDALASIQTLLWTSRVTKLVIYAIVIYFITGYTLRYLKRSAEIQRRFVALASHELRTPLTVMKNALEVTLRRKESLSRDRAIEILEKNLSETNRLSDTVQFLMDYSDVKNKRHAMRFTKINLAEIVEGVGDEYRDAARGAGIEYTMKIDSPLYLYGNAIALRILTTNIIKNAIKYTPKGGAVAVLLAKEDDAIVLTVRDTGIGIRKEELSDIFEPFYRSGHLEQHTGSGMGLGLSMVRDVAVLHGAKITVESTPEEGTNISIFFAPYAS